MYDNEVYQIEMDQMKEQLENLQLELKKLNIES